MIVSILFLCILLITLIYIINGYHNGITKEHYINSREFASQLLTFDVSMLQPCPQDPIMTSTNSIARKPPNELLMKTANNVDQVVNGLNNLNEIIQQIEPTSKPPEPLQIKCDQVEYGEYFVYNDKEYENAENVRNDIRSQVCNNLYESCGRITEFKKLGRSENIDGKTECDYLNNDTELKTLQYTCPSTLHCNSRCDGITFNWLCYQLIRNTNELRDRVWKIRFHRNVFVHVNRDAVVLDTNELTRWRFVNDENKMVVIKMDDEDSEPGRILNLESKRWGIRRINQREIKLITTDSPSEMIQVILYKSYSNNKYLIEIREFMSGEPVGWLSEYQSIGQQIPISSNIEISTQPKTSWELLRARN